MEYFGSRPGEPLEECLEAVRRAQVYVGIVGTRYGSKDKYGVSITQREYEEAYRERKTILIYLLDEQNHPVLPKFVDRGEDAVRLAELRELLKARHTCSLFSSPQDLAVNVGVDLIHQLETKMESRKDERSREFSREIPKLLFEAGYAIGMDSNVIDLSDILELDGDSKLRVRDPAVKEVAIAGYLAVNLCRGNYDVLRHILTFDQRTWLVLIALVRHYGTNAQQMGDFIEKCRDPMQFRLLVALAGELSAGECAEPICRRLLMGSDLHSELSYLRQQVTPIHDVVRRALASMPTTVLPVVERYLEASKKMQRWHQKRVFEFAAGKLRRRIEQGA
jgi:hypothetical protein